MTTQQNKILKYTKQKVFNLFKEYPVEGHNYDHVKRVAKWSKEIAKGENADMFLCEMCAWLHDIGRTKETEIQISGQAHHEWSYLMCREWFKEDKNFLNLTTKQKLIILYSVRYHWNNMANKYDVAYILRDADKLDTLGRVGLQRMIRLFKNDDIKLSNAFRIIYDIYFWISTNTAKKIVKDKKMLEVITSYYKKYLKNRIQKIEL